VFRQDSALHEGRILAVAWSVLGTIGLRLLSSNQLNILEDEKMFIYRSFRSAH
jgi:hypothetical protein